MNPDFTFSPDDLMNPIYCRNCRVHIPAKVSTSGGGYCPDCNIARHHAQVAAQQAQIAVQQQKAMLSQQSAQLLNLNPAMGWCPRCQSPNLDQLNDNSLGSAGRSLKGAGCVLCAISWFVLWPLLVVGIALYAAGSSLGGRRPIGTFGSSLQCRSCGHRWLA